MRDIIIIGIACLVAIGVGLWLFLDGEREATTGADVPFEVLREGQDSGAITERKNYRIKSAEELDTLISMMYATGGPALPPVDFSTHEVLAVFDGTHSSGGYDVEVASVTDEGVRRIVIRRTTPGESCLTTSAITSPYVLAVLPKSSLPIVREESIEVEECR